MIAADAADEREYVVAPSRRAVLWRAAHYSRRNPLVVLGIAIVAFWIIVAVLAPMLAPYAPLRQDIVHRLEEPGWSHPFGTDDLGRDEFSRVLYGARISLPIGAVLVAIGCLFGT